VRRVFKTRYFAKWSRKAGVPDLSLCTAVEEMERGLIDADLGGNLYKKRVALRGKGKRGGARLIVATRLAGIWIFIDAFAKNEKADLTSEQLLKLQEAARELLSQSVADLEIAARGGALEELSCG